jgi:hypothetical protein
MMMQRAEKRKPGKSQQQQLVAKQHLKLGKKRKGAA